MMIAELAERIDQRVATLQQKIGQLEAAKKALAQSSTRPAVTTREPEPSVPRCGRRAHTPTRAGRQPGRTPAPRQRGPKPAAARSLFRELDTGLRTRP